MKFLKYDANTLSVIGVLDSPEDFTISVDDEVANKFLARPKLMLMYKIKNGILIETGLLDTSQYEAIVKPVKELYSWPEWDRDELPNAVTCNAMVTVVHQKGVDRSVIIDYALFHAFHEIKTPVYLVDKDDSLNVLEVLPDISTRKTETSESDSLRLSRLSVWSSLTYKNCFIVDNKTFEQATL